MGAGDAVRREVLAEGVVRLGAGDGTFTYRRPRPRVLHVIIAGADTGQFGTAALDEIAVAIQRERPLELFIDARDTINVAVSVSEDWTRFFATNRESLTRVHVLVGSKFLYLTVAIAQHMSRTGNLMQIYSDPEIFESRLAPR